VFQPTYEFIQQVKFLIMLGRELMPVDCSRHVVHRRQRISRWTSFWSMGLLPVSSSLTTIWTNHNRHYTGRFQVLREDEVQQELTG